MGTWSFFCSFSSSFFVTNDSCGNSRVFSRMKVSAINRCISAPNSWAHYFSIWRRCFGTLTISSKQANTICTDNNNMVRKFSLRSFFTKNSRTNTTSIATRYESWWHRSGNIANLLHLLPVCRYFRSFIGDISMIRVRHCSWQWSRRIRKDHC